MKTLLLNFDYQAISFIPERKVYKLYFKNKVEVISTWDKTISWSTGKMNIPSILRLKNYVPRHHIVVSFSRQAVIKRDKCICQYCGKKLFHSECTMDHVIPKAYNGKSSFLNCVVACFDCNNAKGDRTPSEADMMLLNEPFHPSFALMYSGDDWHDDWESYI